MFYMLGIQKCTALVYTSLHDKYCLIGVHTPGPWRGATGPCVLDPHHLSMCVSVCVSHTLDLCMGLPSYFYSRKKLPSYFYLLYVREKHTDNYMGSKTLGPVSYSKAPVFNAPAELLLALTDGSLSVCKHKLYYCQNPILPARRSTDIILPTYEPLGTSCLLLHTSTKGRKATSSIGSIKEMKVT